jgi:hypothetical protein
VTTSGPAAQSEPRPPRRSAVVAIVAVALVWAGCLAALAVRSANPVVVNRVQVWHADSLVLGVWDAKAARLTVERTWKSPVPADSIAIGTMPQQHPSGRIIVPVTRLSSQQYEVTQGRLWNPPERPAASTEKPVESDVQPLVYPATDDVIRQIEALLSSGQPVE